MGYEYALVIPVILFVGLIVMHYQKNLYYKYLWLCITVISVFFYTFIHPGLFGIKKNPPYLYWTGGNGSSIGKKFDFSFKKIMEKMGFEFVD